MLCAIRMDESASQINIRAASPDELRELVGKLLSGHTAIRQALANPSSREDTFRPALCDTKPIREDHADDKDDEEEPMDDDAVEALKEEPEEDDDGDSKAWWQEARSTTHRKEWMTFGRRFEQADAAVKWPQVAALWNSKGEETWDACSLQVAIVCFRLLA